MPYACAKYSQKTGVLFPFTYNRNVRTIKIIITIVRRRYNRNNNIYDAYYYTTSIRAHEKSNVPAGRDGGGKRIRDASVSDSPILYNARLLKSARTTRSEIAPLAHASALYAPFRALVFGSRTDP